MSRILSDNLTLCKRDPTKLVGLSCYPVGVSAGYTSGMAKIERAEVVRRLKAIREEIGVSPRQLAEMIRVERTTYYSWEQENPKKPSFPAEEAMAELCEVLPGLSLDYIYLGKVTFMRTGLALRLLARELGYTPGEPGAEAAASASLAERAAREPVG